MTKLEEWQNKPNWNKELQMVPVYYLKSNTKIQDIDLRNVCRQAESLTLDLESVSGFEEIGLVPIVDRMNKEYAHICNKVDTLQSLTLNQVIEDVKRILKKHIYETWDSNAKHLFQHSGGCDCRILSYILMELREEHGREWLGEVHFHCEDSHPDNKEGKIFLKVMKKQGWEPGEYTIMWGGEKKKEDYFSNWNFDRNVNGFTIPCIDFHNDIISDEEEKEWTFVNGKMGGELFNYPTYRERHETRFQELLVYGGYPCVYEFGKRYFYSGNILYPYLSYELLEYIFKIPPNLYHSKRLGHDVIRYGILDSFGDDIERVFSPGYNMSISERTQQQIKNRFRKSKFCKDYPQYAGYNPSKSTEIYNRKMLRHKLYGLATMYEGI